MKLDENVEIELLHKRHDQLGQLLRPKPFPGVEFGMVGGDVDIAVGAGESHRKPFLAITAIPAAHHTLRNLVRHFVIKPATALAEDFYSFGADLLLQLTPYRLARSLASVDSTLWHLPRRKTRWHVDAVTNEDEAFEVEQHYPNARAVCCRLPPRRAHH